MTLRSARRKWSTLATLGAFFLQTAAGPFVPTAHALRTEPIPEAAGLEELQHQLTNPASSPNLSPTFTRLITTLLGLTVVALAVGLPTVSTASISGPKDPAFDRAVVDFPGVSSRVIPRPSERDLQPVRQVIIIPKKDKGKDKGIGGDKGPTLKPQLPPGVRTDPNRPGEYLQDPDPLSASQQKELKSLPGPLKKALEALLSEPVPIGRNPNGQAVALHSGEPIVKKFFTPELEKLKKEATQALEKKYGAKDKRTVAVAERLRETVSQIQAVLRLPLEIDNIPLARAIGELYGTLEQIDPSLVRAPPKMPWEEVEKEGAHGWKIRAPYSDYKVSRGSIDDVLEKGEREKLLSTSREVDSIFSFLVAESLLRPPEKANKRILLTDKEGKKYLFHPETYTGLTKYLEISEKAFSDLKGLQKDAARPNLKRLDQDLEKAVRISESIEKGGVLLPEGFLDKAKGLRQKVQGYREKIGEASSDKEPPVVVGLVDDWETPLKNSKGTHGGKVEEVLKKNRAVAILGYQTPPGGDKKVFREKMTDVVLRSLQAGAQVLSVSWYVDNDPELERALRPVYEWAATQVPIFAGAGNTSTTVSLAPASYKGVFSVSAKTKRKESQPRFYTTINLEKSFDPQSGVWGPDPLPIRGTSFVTPEIAAAAAAEIQKDPTLQRKHRELLKILWEKGYDPPKKNQREERPEQLSKAGKIVDELCFGFPPQALPQPVRDGLVIGIAEGALPVGEAVAFLDELRQDWLAAGLEEPVKVGNVGLPPEGLLFEGLTATGPNGETVLPEEGNPLLEALEPGRRRLVIPKSGVEEIHRLFVHPAVRLDPALIAGLGEDNIELLPDTQEASAERLSRAGLGIGDAVLLDVPSGTERAWVRLNGDDPAAKPAVINLAGLPAPTTLPDLRSLVLAALKRPDGILSLSSQVQAGIEEVRVLDLGA